MTEAPASPRPAPGKRISFALAVLMHVLLAVLLIYGIRWQTQREEVVQVEVVRAVPPAPTPAKEAAPEPKPEPPPPPKPEPKVEPPKPAPKPEIAQKEKPKPAPKPAPDPFQEQLKREEEQLLKQKEAVRAAQELEELKARQAAQAQAGEMDKYIAAIRGKVRGNIVLPANIKGNPEAQFEVTQLPSGEVLTVKLRKSSGHAAYDAAIERAILKSSPLPKPAKPELFSRTLTLTFRPQED